MKTLNLLLGVLAISSLGITSCTKSSSTGNATANYQVKTSNRSYTVVNSSATVAWTAGYANVTQIQFEAESANGHVKFSSEAVQKIDLFATVSALGKISIPAGTYNQTQFEIELAPTATADAFQLSGNYNGTPLVFKVAIPYELDAEMANVTIASDKSYLVINTIDLSKLTLGITAADLSNAVKDSSGTIVISANTNSSIYTVMLVNLHKLVENADIQ